MEKIQTNELMYVHQFKQAIVNVMLNRNM